jgi:hypothetical protein
MHLYMFDNSATAEYQRLDLMSKILDPDTRTHLAALGLREGWNCLELGGGNGSITEWLCEMVGASGSVTSIDIDPKLIRLVPAQNLAVRQADLRTTDLPTAAFDLVMCRAMLHQIAEHAPVVLARMAAAVNRADGSSPASLTSIWRAPASRKRGLTPGTASSSGARLREWTGLSDADCRPWSALWDSATLKRRHTSRIFAEPPGTPFISRCFLKLSASASSVQAWWMRRR